MKTLYHEYVLKSYALLAEFDFGQVHRLAMALKTSRENQQRIFICGNGGSAANAMHMANDLLIAACGHDPATQGKGLQVTALSADNAVITTLANDRGYEYIFSGQLEVQARQGDILIALSGSGNSPNIVNALETAHKLGMTSFAILGYSGGKCKALADHAIHFPIDDMQISEDMQLMVGHMAMRAIMENWTYPPPKKA